MLEMFVLSEVGGKKLEQVACRLTPLLNDRSDCRILSMYATGRLAEKR
jgi:hypothetical protein